MSQQHTPPTDPMFGRMIGADFEANTITFEMEPGYFARAGRFMIAPAEVSADRPRWTPEDDKALVKSFEAIGNEMAVAVKLDRPVRFVHLRLVALGKLLPGVTG